MPSVDDYGAPAVAASAASTVAWVIGGSLVVYSVYLAATGRSVLPWAAVALGLLLFGAALGAAETVLSERRG